METVLITNIKINKKLVGNRMKEILIYNPIELLVIKEKNEKEL
jgi:hypothetical protein